MVAVLAEESFVALQNILPTRSAQAKTKREETGRSSERQSMIRFKPAPPPFFKNKWVGGRGWGRGSGPNLKTRSDKELHLLDTKLFAFHQMIVGVENAGNAFRLVALEHGINWGGGREWTTT
jgi:hypothetical protein